MTEEIDFENPILVPFAATSIHKIQYIFSFEYVDFWPKIFLILYPSLGILTTQITIVCHGQYFKCKTPEGGYYRNLEKKWEEENLMNIHFCSHLQIWNSNSWVDACSSSLLLLFTDLNSLLKIVIYDLKLKNVFYQCKTLNV